MYILRLYAIETHNFILMIQQFKIGKIHMIDLFTVIFNIFRFETEQSSRTSKIHCITLLKTRVIIELGRSQVIFLTKTNKLSIDRIIAEQAIICTHP